MPKRSGISVIPLPSRFALSGPLIGAGLILLATPLVRLLNLDQLGITFCYFKATTGQPCFTCGTTRALGHLAKFDLASAFVVQPLVTVGVLFLLLWGLVDAVLMARSQRTSVALEGRALRLASVTLGVLAVLNWIYLIATGV
jgi:hypothetical protein